MLVDSFSVFVVFSASYFLTALTQLLDTLLVSQSTGRDVPSPSFSIERANAGFRNLFDSINWYSS